MGGEEDAQWTIGTTNKLWNEVIPIHFHAVPSIGRYNDEDISPNSHNLIVNQSMPRAVVHGPIQFGGMDIVKHLSLQDQWNLDYFVQSLRWDKTIADDIITVLDAYQVASGFVTPVLASPNIEVDYLAPGLISHIRSR